eukprot:SAG31_NODE_2139_length_6349_cov_2.773636_13_plen_133_part_01
MENGGAVRRAAAARLNLSTYANCMKQIYVDTVISSLSISNGFLVQPCTQSLNLVPAVCEDFRLTSLHVQYLKVATNLVLSESRPAVARMEHGSTCDAAAAAKELGSLCGRGVVEVTRYRDLFFKINRSGEHSC